MIDIKNESVLSLTNAAKRLPKRRRGKRPHVSTLYRWAQRGIKGVKLETIRIGGTLCTSMEALQRFFERCTNPTQVPSTRTSRQRERDVKRAEKRLNAAGI